MKRSTIFHFLWASPLRLLRGVGVGLSGRGSSLPSLSRRLRLMSSRAKRSEAEETSVREDLLKTDTTEQSGTPRYTPYLPSGEAAPLRSPRPLHPAGPSQLGVLVPWWPFLCASLRLLRLTHLPIAMLFLALALFPLSMFAQQSKDSGQEAQAGRESEGQEKAPATLTTSNSRFLGLQDQNPQIHYSLTAPSAAPDLNPQLSILNSPFSILHSPQKPQKPAPLILFLVGFAMLALWGLLLVGAIASSSALFVTLFIIGVIVFSPILIIGIILIVGGIAAATSGGKAKKQMSSRSRGGPQK